MLKRLFGKREKPEELQEPVIPTEFIEVHVPIEYAIQFNLKRSWKPADGRDFRIVLDNKGLSVFPRRKLTKADYAGIAVLAADTERGGGA
jgi:hypothetical protein